MTDRPGLENVEDVYPLSPLQQGMLFHTIAAPESSVFVNQITTRLEGSLDVPAFKAACQALIDRHASLRTAFVWDGLDQPLQVVRQQAELAWWEQDWRGVEEAERNGQREALLRDDRGRGFDLTSAPLTRMGLIRTAPASWLWVWTSHHLIADGWSAQVLLDELFAFYRANRNGESIAPGEPFRYREFIATHTARDEAQDEAFWRQRLAGFTSPHRLEVPGLIPETNQRGHMAHTVTIDTRTAAAVRAFAKEQHITLNTAFLGAWALLLSRWVRERDVVFGFTTAGRDTNMPGVERGVGLFINTLPVRAQVSPERRLGDWLRELQEYQLEAHSYEQSSLASVQRWSDTPPGQALFESILVFENMPAAADRTAGTGLEIGATDFIEHSNYPLAILVQPGESFEIRIVYDSARFPAEAIESVGGQMAALLGQFPDGAGQHLSRLQLTGPDDDERLRVWDTGPALADEGRCIHEIIETVARRHPEATAVVSEGRSITYSELDSRAEVIAGRLRLAGAEPNRLVGLHLSRSIEMVVGMLAILKAGGAYVPLDPTYPPQHIRRLVEDDGIEIVLTDVAGRDHIPSSGLAVAIDDAGPSPEIAPSPRAVTPADLAYVIHTSGSTGRPKGVMVSHSNLVHSTLARNAHYGSPVERFLLLSSFAFDSSLVGIFWTLCTGGTLVLPTPKLEQDIEQLLSLMSTEQITHLLCLPALYQLIVDHARPEELSSLKVAIVAGEACPSGILESHLAGAPGAELHNEYGPTEGTVWCSAHQATESDRGGPLPIGRPIAGTRIHLLDEHGNRPPPGFAGEVCVAGTGVSAGYRNRPDLTAERFVTVDLDGKSERLYRTGDLACYRFDGTLLFLGRADFQLKIRGHRIETGAVEAEVRSHPSIREVAVAGRSAPGSSSAQLIAYVVAPDGPGGLSRLRADLHDRLPEYMVPDGIVPVAELPRLPNGKVDYGALPELWAPDPGSADSFVAPRTDAEAKLATIWADLLGVDKVGIRDDFFALGGDSIISIRMISQARQAGIYIRPGQISSAPTVERLVAEAGDSHVSPAEQGPVVGTVGLGPIQQWFLESDLAAPHHWNQSGVFEVPIDLDLDALRTALQACVDHHDMLRARFEYRNDEWHQTIDTERYVDVEVVDLEGSDVDHLMTSAQASLDLGSGPLVGATLIRRRNAANHLLLIVVHHLVIDVVSWTVFIEDLESSYLAARGRSTITFPPRTTSYREWVNHLRAQDRSTERDYWVTAGAYPKPSLDDSYRRVGTEATRRVLRTQLDADLTRTLLTAANEAYQTRPEDILLAALSEALADWSSGGTVGVALESHGRLDNIDGIDLSRTVGWFTASYVVALPVPSQGRDGDFIKAIKEHLRAVPGGGIGYGALRYLDGDEDLTRQETPAVLFNYVGRAMEAGSGRIFSWVSAADSSSRGELNTRSHQLEVVAAVREGRLTIEWQYGDGLHDEPMIQQVAGTYMASLQRLIDHCLSDAAGGFTPSDFPEAGLDQAELDRFLEDIV